MYAELNILSIVKTYGRRQELLIKDGEKER